MIESPIKVATANAMRNMIKKGNHFLLVNGAATTPMSDPVLTIAIDIIIPIHAKKKVWRGYSK